MRNDKNKNKLICIEELTPIQLNKELEKGYNDIKEGKTFSLNPNVPQSLNKEVEFSASEETLEKETLIDIGKRYRENYNLFRKKHIIKSNLIFFIFFSIFLGGSIALTILFKELICFILLGLCLISLLIYCWLFPMYLKDLENEPIVLEKKAQLEGRNVTMYIAASSQN
jgi:hypothetical protein